MHANSTQSSFQQSLQGSWEAAGPRLSESSSSPTAEEEVVPLAPELPQAGKAQDAGRPEPAAEPAALPERQPRQAVAQQKAEPGNAPPRQVASQGPEHPQVGARLPVAGVVPTSSQPDALSMWGSLLQDAAGDAWSAAAGLLPTAQALQSALAPAASAVRPVGEALQDASAALLGALPSAAAAAKASARYAPASLQLQAKAALETFVAAHPQYRELLRGQDPILVVLAIACLGVLALALAAHELSGCWRAMSSLGRCCCCCCRYRRARQEVVAVSGAAAEEGGGGGAGAGGPDVEQSNAEAEELKRQLAEVEAECARLRTEAAEAAEAARVAHKGAAAAEGGGPQGGAARAPASRARDHEDLPTVPLPCSEEASGARQDLQATVRCLRVVQEEADRGDGEEEPLLAQRRPRAANDDLLPTGVVPPCPKTCTAKVAGSEDGDRRRRWTVADASHEEELASPWSKPGNAQHAGATPIAAPMNVVHSPVPSTAATLPAGTAANVGPSRTPRASLYKAEPDAADFPFMKGEIVEVLKDDGETWVDAKVETTFGNDDFDEVEGQVYSVPRGTVKVSCELGTKYVMPQSVGATLRKKVEDSTMPKLPSHLELVQQLGEGAYGEVFLCDNHRDGTQVAIKWVRDFTRDPLFGKRILREIRILAAMDHPNLLQLLDVLPMPSPDCDDVYFVMPYMHCDLHKVIYSKAVLSEPHAQAFACQILRGLKYLHSAGVVHRDLKPSNILVNRDCTLRIADLGLARGKAFEEEELTDYVVTRWYRAPELMLLPDGYFEAIDLWSVGCIHVELHTRRPLFPGENHVSMLRSIAKTLGFSMERDLRWLPAEGAARDGALRFVSVLNLPEQPSKPLQERMQGASEECLDFVRKLLEFDPTSRLSAADAVAHEYLRHLRDAMAEVDAPRPFAWDFDRFEPTERALKDRIYAQCAWHHPEIISRDADIIEKRGLAPMLQMFSGSKGYIAPPPRAPNGRSRSRTPGAAGRSLS